MRIGDQSPKDNQQKLSGSSEDQPKEAKKGLVLNLNKLIFLICCAIIVFVGVNFVSCNFMIPGTINTQNVQGKLKNPPPTDCKESERRGYETLLAILTTIIALKTRMDDE